MVGKSKGKAKTETTVSAQTPARARRRNSKLASTTLETLKKSLLARRQQLVGDMDQMASEVLGESRLVSNGDVSAMPTHMADVATDVYEQEFALELMANEREELRQIDHALERMALGEFGVCEECGGRIRHARLKALPQARSCIDCKRMMEQGKG